MEPSSKAELTTPLLISSTIDAAPQAQVTLTIESSSSEPARSPGGPETNPFDFLLAPSLSLPPQTPLDPFRNHTPSIEGLYEWSKIVICVPIAILRLVLFGVCLLVGYVATKCALLGWKDRESPMPKWRYRVMWVTRVCSRCILFCFGYHWIKRKGRPTSREIAPIVVSNHVSYIEPIFFFYELFPTIVASESHDAIPLVGTIIRAMQVIYINRFSAPSRKHAINEIKRKASCNRFPRILLFPEGTTTNGRVLISFQLGAFLPAFSIQPVVVRYPHVHFDQSWGNISLTKLMFRMFTQIHNFMEVEYLPVIAPHQNKNENAIHFSQRTMYAMASSLNVVQTFHSYGDLMLLAKASQLRPGRASIYMVEMARVERLFNVRTLEALEFLDEFFSMNPDPSGHVKIFDFLRVLRLELNPLSEKIFGFLDEEMQGSVTFRQFLLGSAHIRKQPLFMQACEVAFDGCDSEKKGYITQQQLGDGFRSAVPDMSDENVFELFNLLDIDKDGRLSRDDFMTCLRKKPLLIALFSSYCSTSNCFVTQIGD